MRDRTRLFPAQAQALAAAPIPAARPVSPQRLHNSGAGRALATRRESERA